MGKKKVINIPAAIVDVDYKATLRYYQILEESFGIKIESSIVTENEITTYTEKVSKTAGCNPLFNFVFDPDATTIITPTQRNGLLATLVTTLDYAEKFLELADEAKKVGLRFSCFNVDLYHDVRTYVNSHKISFFDCYGGKGSAYNYVQFDCDADGLEKFTALIYSRLGRHLLGDYALPLMQHGIKIAINDNTDEFLLAFEPSCLRADFEKFENKIRDYYNTHLPEVHEVGLPMDAEDLQDLTNLLDGFCEFFANLC